MSGSVVRRPGRRFLAHGIALFALGVAATLPPAEAQTYPTRPIRLIVPNPPGGATDNIARLEYAKYGEVVRAVGAKID